MLKYYNFNYLCLCYNSTRLRSDQPPLYHQTELGWCSQCPTKSVRRTSQFATGAIQRPVSRRQVARLDSSPQHHNGRGALHRTTKRRKCINSLHFYRQLDSFILAVLGKLLLKSN